MATSPNKKARYKATNAKGKHRPAKNAHDDEPPCSPQPGPALNSPHDLLLDKETHFRILKWRRLRPGRSPAADVASPDPGCAAAGQATQLASLSASAAQLVAASSLKQRKKRDLDEAPRRRSSVRDERQASGSSSALSPAPTQAKPKACSMAKYDGPSLQSEGTSQVSAVVANNESVAFIDDEAVLQQALKPRPPGNRPSASRPCGGARRSGGRDTSDTKLESAVLSKPKLLKERRPAQPCSDEQRHGPEEKLPADAPGSGLVQGRPGKLPATPRTLPKTPLRSNLSVSRHAVETMHGEQRTPSSTANDAGASNSLKRAPVPRKRRGRPSAHALIESQSYATGVPLGRSSIQRMDTKEVKRLAQDTDGEHGHPVPDTSLHGLTKSEGLSGVTSMKQCSQTSLSTTLSRLVAATVASDANAGTQREFQTAVEGTDHFQAQIDQPWQEMPSESLVSGLQGSVDMDLSAYEGLFAAAADDDGVIAPFNLRYVEEGVVMSASLASLNRSSLSEISAEPSPSLSKPGRGAVAADFEKPARCLSHPIQEGGFNSTGYVKEHRTSVPLEALRSGVGAFEVKRPSRGEVVDGEADPSFYSEALMGLAALDPGEKLASVGGVDRRLRAVFQGSSAPSKAEAGRRQSSLYAAVSQGSLANFDAELPKPHDEMTARVPGTAGVDCAHHERRSKLSNEPQSDMPSPIKRPFPSAARSARASTRTERRENCDEGRSSRLSPLPVQPIPSPGEQVGAVNNVAKGVHVDGCGETATDSTFYTASERLTATGKHAWLGTMARDLSSAPGFTKALDKTNFLHLDLEYAGFGPKEVNSRILGKTSASTEEYLTALNTAVELSGPCLVYRAPKDVCSRARVQEGPLTSAFSHRPRMCTADPYRATTKATISRLQSEGKGQRNSPERCKLFDEAYGESSSEDLLPSEDVRFSALPRRGEMSSGRHICSHSPDKIVRRRNLAMDDFYAPDIENRSPSSAARDAWRAAIPGLLMASSPPMSEGGDSVRLVLFPRAAGLYGGAEQALFPGVSDILDRRSLLSTASEFVMSHFPFHTARSLSEPNIVALRPAALDVRRSFSDSMIVNASSAFSLDSMSPDMSSPGHTTLRRTIDLAEDRRLPKVAPKKKRPKPAVALKPTTAQTNVSRNHPAEAFPSAPSPESTGVEVSMKAKSHAKELCLSMLGVAVTVLGLVFVSKSVGRNMTGIRIFTTGQAGTSEAALTRRVATESSHGSTTIPFSVPPRNLVCNLTRCREDGRFLASSLSWDRDPCVDFYGFACAKWAEARAASAAVAGGASASVVEDMERDLERRAARLLATARSPELAPLRRMHDACNDVNAIHAAGWAPLGALLQLCHLPHWPYDQPSTVSAWKAAARAHQYTGAETLISVLVTPHPLRANRSISALDRPRLALRAADLVAQDFHWLEDTADTVMTAFRERPRQLAREAVAMAVQIARLTYSRDALSDVRMYRVSNLGPFPQLLEFLSTLFANVSSVHASTEVVLRAEGFLSDLLDLADERRNRALLNYIGLQVVVHCSAFLPDAVGLQAVHARLLFPDEASAGYVPRERLCVRQAARTMPFLFFYALRVVFGGEATVRALTAALETLRRCLADHFSAVALGDSATRSQLAAIVRETRLHVMGPPVVANESLVLEHALALPPAGDDGPLAWFARVTAHVSQIRVMRLSRYVWPGGAFDRDCASDLQANEIFVPPLFVNASGGTWDRGGLVLQMPQLGGRFARCVLLMLLSGVSNRANRELVTRGWWSDGAKASLSALRRCLARRSDDASSAKAPMSRVADAIALPALLAAFARGLHAIAGPEASFRLPHVQDLVPEQLFFAAYALARCRREQPAHRRETADDVNAALRQSPAFRAAFECRMGLPMSPDAACTH